MKITKKTLERIINEEIKKLIEQEADMSGGEFPLASGGNKATVEGLEVSLSAVHEKLERIIAMMSGKV
jgi:hypothetical protein